MSHGRRSLLDDRASSPTSCKELTGSQQSGHAGFSVAIRRGDTIRFPDDLKARLFFGLCFFPGTDIHRFDLAPGVGAEVFVTPRTVLGFNAAVFMNQGFGGLHLRTVIGP